MAKAKKAVEIVCVLDRSGSMQSIANDAIGGFNAFLKEQQAVKGKANLTLILFDHEYQVAYDSVPIGDAKPLTAETFVPRGMTAMNDAIGRALSGVEAKAPEKAIVCILTDGLENASKEVSASMVKKQIEAAKARGWSFVYLAANQDAFATGESIGMDKSMLHNFAATSVGTQSAYMTMCAVTKSYRAK